ncbi:MAG: hypothetical protein C4307_03275 [Chloroflexota bacterium]
MDWHAHGADSLSDLHQLLGHLAELAVAQCAQSAKSAIECHSQSQPFGVLFGHAGEGFGTAEDVHVAAAHELADGACQFHLHLALGFDTQFLDFELECGFAVGLAIFEGLAFDLDSCAFDLHLLASDVDLDHLERGFAFSDLFACLGFGLCACADGFRLQFCCLLACFRLLDFGEGLHLHFVLAFDALLLDLLFGSDELGLCLALGSGELLDGDDLLIGAFALGLSFQCGFFGFCPLAFRFGDGNLFFTFCQLDGFKPFDIGSLELLLFEQ